MGTSDPQQKSFKSLGLLCVSGVWAVFGEKRLKVEAFHVEFIQNRVALRTSRKDLILGLKMYFVQEMIAYCMNAILFTKFSKRKQVYVYTEVETIDCSKQIWDLLTAIHIYIYIEFIVYVWGLGCFLGKKVEI